MPGGFGGGAFGGGAFGGSVLALVAAAAEFDVFCFQGADMFTMLSDPNVTGITVGAGPPPPFFANVTTLDLEMCSGVLFPAENVRAVANYNVPDSFTVEWIAKLQDLPNDFTDLVNNHIYFGATDAAGPLVGLFFSKAGVGYTGSVSFPGGDLQLDTTFQLIPGSSAWVTDTEYLVIRAAADLTLGFVYLYITPLSEIATTGQQLRAILPIIPYTAAAVAPVDQSIVSVRGTAGSQSCVYLDSWCLGTALIIPNLAPVASAGLDQAVRSCSIIQLDGSQSFDPEGVPVLYQWRLVDAPLSSEFAIEGPDGRTYPLAVPTGSTDKFHSATLGTLDALDPFDVGTGGDVLLLDGVAYTVTGTGIDGNGFFVQLGQPLLPDGLVSAQFKLLRQRGLSGPTTVNPTFFPDIPGFFVFDLIVCDGTLFSAPGVVVLSVLESALPRGCTPDLSFIFNYLSDFWNLVEGRERIETFWGALAQTAASELFSLWQVEYSKSHRDIQRTFNRRWLHYDLLLGEPLPELTTTRAVFGGVTSSYFAAAGVGGVNGTTIVLSSPVLAEDLTVTVVSLDPVAPATLAGELRTALTAVDDRFSTSVIEDRLSTDLAVRIEAPFPFTIAPSSTTSLFAANAQGRPPVGTGTGVGSSVYKVDRSLEGLGLVEDDFLVLDGAAYRIARLVDDSGDQFAFQRVVTKETLPTVPSTSWAISGWVRSELLDFYNGLVDAGDYVDFEASEVTDATAPASAIYALTAVACLGVSSSLPGRMAVDFWPVGAALADSTQNVYLARIVRRHYAPVHETVLDVPVLSDKVVITDEDASLRRNVDYFIEDVRGGRAIRFAAGFTGDAGSVWEGARPPNRLWAEYTYFDNSEVIEANFGIPVDLTADQLAELPDTVDYLSAVRGLWYAYFNGPSVQNLRIGVQILLGLPFAEQKGVIEEIRTDFSPTNGRMLIRDSVRTEIIRSYNWPRVLDLEVNPDTEELYQVGDTVEQFAPLVEGAEVIDYVNNPTWFEGLLNQGVFYEAEKFHKFMVRINSAAFNLSSLLFVRNFVLNIKPTYTFPLFVVLKEVDEAEVSTTDLVTMSSTLSLSDTPCEILGASFHYDQPRPTGGGFRNQFDGDADPDNAAPTFPTSDAVAWGFDKAYFCSPSVEVVAVCCETFAVPTTVLFDSCFAFDTPVGSQTKYADALPTPIPAGPAGYTMAVVGSNLVPTTGLLTQLRFGTLGTPGADPTDYEVAIDVNAVEVASESFTAGTNTEILRTLALAVTAGDAVDVRVRPATGGARTPSWTSIFARVSQEDAAVWTFGALLPVGTYCREGVV